LLLEVIEHCIKTLVIEEEIDKALITLSKFGVEATVISSFIRIAEDIVQIIKNLLINNVGELCIVIPSCRQMNRRFALNYRIDKDYFLRLRLVSVRIDGKLVLNLF